ncbi:MULTISPECIES: SDR family oxidoreductase [Modicisalibacter]|uniref:SDR family oxidoreductase n=1 Tax=Modicisalibacter TaxID=574347 RepID=UPI00100A7D07|nr:MULTISPECIES: SDR family oxidoreductase [Halomonadaceae]MBZ9559378.1 SDR family oxidoreductase [Modicisalibacter sp. R2A 31.J]MBZ9576457.1 SDR family oxidoreductase [Modicisalibacter sp. MOD 31.J]
MHWSDRRILLTGASGGIGRALAGELARRGARLLLVGRNPAALQALVDELPTDADWRAVDLCDAEARRGLVETARELDIDMLINAAGVNRFGLFAHQSPESVSELISLNVTATLQLTQAMLPLFKAADEAWVVNLGSTFGAIGYPGYASYCASKAALRGFSQALRRELADTAIHVHYVAPRATRTAMNDATVDALNAELGNAMDNPERVAEAIVRAVDQRAADRHLGWPERLFVRLNAVVPGLVDRALRRQLATIQRFASRP